MFQNQKPTLAENTLEQIVLNFVVGWMMWYRLAFIEQKTDPFEKSGFQKQKKLSTSMTFEKDKEKL